MPDQPFIDTVQSQVLSALEDSFPSYDVQRPESLRRYEFLNPEAAILVILRDARWGESPVQSGTYRRVQPEFAIMSLTHGHEAEPSATDVLAGIEDTIEGLTVDGTEDHPGGQMRIQRQFYDQELPGGGVTYITLARLEP